MTNLRNRTTLTRTVCIGYWNVLIPSAINIFFDLVNSGGHLVPSPQNLLPVPAPAPAPQHYLVPSNQETVLLRRFLPDVPLQMCWIQIMMVKCLRFAVHFQFVVGHSLLHLQCCLQCPSGCSEFPKQTRPLMHLTVDP